MEERRPPTALSRYRFVFNLVTVGPQDVFIDR